MVEHLARITWSEERRSRGLPTIPETVGPAWSGGATVAADDAWSLTCRFDVPPSGQSNPSTAWVRFLFAEAPRSAHHAGPRPRLFERSTRAFATVEILE